MNTVLLALSFLFFAFTTKPSLATFEPVLDLDGDPLLPTSQYYVRSPFWPGGGGLGLARTGNQIRPVSVIREPSFTNNGRALVFTPTSQTEQVFADSDLEIKFAEKPDGVSTASWLLVNDLNNAWSVGIGNSVDHPGSSILEGYFRIHKLSALAYTLSFRRYPSSNSLGVDIGIMNDNNGFTRLVAKEDEPYLVTFSKASPEVTKM